MKLIKKLLTLILLSPLLLHAESYTISGGKNNFAHTIAADIIVKAYSRAGLTVTPLFINLQESLDRADAGETDGEIARIAKITQFTPNLRQVPVSIISIQAVAYSKDTSIVINDWNDLAGLNPTIVQGTKFIEIGTKNIDREFAPSFEAALDRLHEDKTKIVVVPKLAGTKLIYQKKYHDIKAVSPVLKQLKLYHFVHKKNKHLIPVITPVLQKMKDSGEIEFIRKAHLLKTTSGFSSK